jgi:hypothetical protein
MPRSEESVAVRENLILLLEEHRAAGTIPTSHRFLFYELVARGVIAKHREEGGRADAVSSRELFRLREEGLIEWEEITDETRSLEDYAGYPSVGRAWLSWLSAVKLDPWLPRRAPLILTESRSLAGALRKLAREYRTLLCATNGQVGGFLHTDIGPRLVPAMLVFYLGDYDLAGNDIEYNTRTELEKIVGGRLAWRRVALTGAQVQAHSLPVIDKTDGRFLFDGGEHGAVETEALKQEVITDLVRDALDADLPFSLDETLENEKAEREILRKELLLAFPELEEEKRDPPEEPELTDELIEIAEEMEAAHLLRKAEGKLRRAYSKAGKTVSRTEISQFLLQLNNSGLSVDRITEISSSRLSRAIAGKISFESLVYIAPCKRLIAPCRRF